jgi:magnesium chelatase family protein
MGLQLIKIDMDRLSLSAREYDRILKVSRTITDPFASPQVLPIHLAEPINYHNFDREA